MVAPTLDALAAAPVLLPPTTASAVQVFTNSTLFHTVVAFINGVPQHVLQFKETEMPRHRRLRVGYFTSMPVQPLALWEVAILCSNKRVLEALTELASSQRYRDCSHVHLDSVIGFAVANISDVPFIEWLYTHFCTIDVQRAIIEREFQTLAWRSTRDTDEDIAAVAQWLHSHQYLLPSSFMDTAAAAGNLVLVRFLHEHSWMGCTRNAQTEALENGHIEVLRFLFEHHSEGCYPDAVNIAALNGHIDCIVFAHTHNFDGFSVVTMSNAVKNGHLGVVAFLHEHRTEGCTLKALVDADRNRHDHVVEFLCCNRPVANIGDAIRYAVGNGRGTLAAQLARQRLPWSASISTNERFEYPH